MHLLNLLFVLQQIFLYRFLRNPLQYLKSSNKLFVFPWKRSTSFLLIQLNQFCNNNNSIISYEKTTLIFLFLALFALSASAKKTRLYCQTTATSECASGFKFRVTASDSSGFDASYCLPQGQICSLSNDNQIYVQACTKDYKNNPCSVGACYYTGLKNVCAKDFTTCSSTVDAYNFFCVNCNTIANCAKCFIGYKNGAVNTAEVCLGATCGTVTGAQVSVATCNAGYDDFGAKCTCCGKPTVNVSACVSNNAALSLTSVVNWIVSNSSSNSSSNSTSSKFEPSYYLYTLAMLFIAFLIA